MGVLPLPELRAPVIPNVVEQQTRLAQLQSLYANQQTQQLQQQGLEQENQMRAQQIKDANTARTLAQNPKYITRDQDGNVSGYDYDKYTTDLSASGVGPAMLTQVQTMRKNAADTLLAQQSGQEKAIQNHEAINKQAWEKIEGYKDITDPAEQASTWPQIVTWAKTNGADVRGIPPTPPTKDQLAAIEAGLAMHTQATTDAKTSSEAARNTAETALTNLKLKGLQASPQDINAAVAGVVPANWSDPTLAQRTIQRMNSARVLGDLDGMNKALADASTEIGAVKKETNPDVIAGKERVSAAEGKAKQLMQGLAEPVYSMDAQGHPTLMSKTDALQSGSKVILPVTEKQVSDDTKLINRLGDVHQKVAQYEEALQKPVSSKDQLNIAALLGTTQTKAGVSLGGLGSGLNLEIPMERVDAALNKINLQGLSANARDQLIAYRNAREAMMGYKTVLSGSSRGSDKSMDLLTQALPDPSTTDPDFSQRSMTAFKQNLHVVGQGLPRIPGVKSPEEIEAEVNGKSAAPTSQTTQPQAPKTKAAKYGVPIQ